MIYILFALLITHSGSAASISAEFNSKEACSAAADMFQKQAAKADVRPDRIIFCVAKGVKDAKG